MKYAQKTKSLANHISFALPPWGVPTHACAWSQRALEILGDADLKLRTSKHALGSCAFTRPGIPSVSLSQKSEPQSSRDPCKISQGTAKSPSCKLGGVRDKYSCQVRQQNVQTGRSCEHCAFGPPGEPQARDHRHAAQHVPLRWPRAHDWPEGCDPSQG